LFLVNELGFYGTYFRLGNEGEGRSGEACWQRRVGWNRGLTLPGWRGVLELFWWRFEVCGAERGFWGLNGG